VSGGTATSLQGSSFTTADKVKKTYSPINDVIFVQKASYLNYRVIVTNSDTSGIEIEMIDCAGFVADVDSNYYQTVQIGNQVWMAENLRTIRYNDGTDITHLPDSAAWTNTVSGAYCYYNNTTNADSIRKFGVMYNWYVIDTKKLAPTGWHIPDTTEWNTLRDYLITNGYNWNGTTVENRIAKSLAARTDWESWDEEGAVGCDVTQNNRTGFSALPAGFRGHLANFYYLGNYTHWWSSVERDVYRGRDRYLYYSYDILGESSDRKNCGISVRCVKD
jgi:uncharacterized protein (TIGR02145 family)